MIALSLRIFTISLLVFSCLALPMPESKDDEEKDYGEDTQSPTFKEVSRDSDEDGCKVTITVTLFETK